MMIPTAKQLEPWFATPSDSPFYSLNVVRLMKVAQHGACDSCERATTIDDAVLVYPLLSGATIPPVPIRRIRHIVCPHGKDAFGITHHRGSSIENDHDAVVQWWSLAKMRSLALYELRDVVACSRAAFCPSVFCDLGIPSVLLFPIAVWLVENNYANIVTAGDTLRAPPVELFVQMRSSGKKIVAAVRGVFGEHQRAMAASLADL